MCVFCYGSPSKLTQKLLSLPLFSLWHLLPSLLPRILHFTLSILVRTLCRDAASYCYDFLIIIFIYLFIWLCQVFSCSMRTLRASLVAQLVKSPPAMQETTGLTPGLGRSPGEGIDYPLQYSWVSLVAQTVKIPPAVWETWIQSMSWEDPLEKGMATLSSILAWRIPMDRGAWQVTVHGVTKCWTQLSD